MPLTLRVFPSREDTPGGIPSASSASRMRGREARTEQSIRALMYGSQGLPAWRGRCQNEEDLGTVASLNAWCEIWHTTCSSYGKAC